MPPNKTLSIVTISFNQRAYLRQAVESVLSQKTDEVEYIVVDPGSTDGSREILASYGDAIDHLVLEPDDGPADGLNKGFALARGRYGYFINSDDFILPGGVDRLLELWRRHADADALVCGAWLIDADGRPKRELRPTPISQAALLGGGAAVVQQGFSFRMDMFRSVGGFNPANRTCWDGELICDLARSKAHFQLCKARIGVFRVHDACLSGGVAGAAHSARYRADVERIYKRITGKPRARTALQTTVARFAKHLKQPSIAWGYVRDQLVPGDIDRRWRADMARPSLAIRRTRLI